MDTLNELEKLKENYENARNMLQKYSNSGGTINIPISAVGFVVGRLTNPNEVFIYLSPELTLKTNLQGCESVIEEKLKGLNANISQLKSPEPEPIEKIFEKLKVLEEQEKSTNCLGSIVEKVSKEGVKEEEKGPVRVSKFKQEMQLKKK